MEEKISTTSNNGGRGFPRDMGRGDHRGGRGSFGGRGGRGNRSGGFGRISEKFKGLIEELPVLYYSNSDGAKVVHDFLRDMKIYTMQHFIKDMDNIFNITDPKYPEKIEPSSPNDVTNVLKVEKWKLML